MVRVGIELRGFEFSGEVTPEGEVGQELLAWCAVSFLGLASEGFEVDDMGGGKGGEYLAFREGKWSGNFRCSGHSALKI